MDMKLDHLRVAICIRLVFRFMYPKEYLALSVVIWLKYSYVSRKGIVPHFTVRNYTFEDTP